MIDRYVSHTRRGVRGHLEGRVNWGEKERERERKKCREGDVVAWMVGKAPNNDKERVRLLCQ